MKRSALCAWCARASAPMADKKHRTKHRANLKPAWRKGQSGNPRGRPRGKSVRTMARAAGIDPRAFLVSVVGDGRRALRYRIEAARALMPYMHPRVASTVLA